MHSWPTTQLRRLAEYCPDWVVDRAGVIACGLAIVILCIAAYWNSLHAPFLLDDQVGIVGNPASHHVLSRGILAAPEGSDVQGRPLVNLTLVINYKIWKGVSLFDFPLISPGKI